MYFEPGTGSMIVQMLIATLASIGAFIVAFRTNFLSFLKNLFNKNKKK